MRRLNEWGITCLLDHMLMTNMSYMSNLASVKGLFAKYENFLRAYQDHDMEHVVVENNYLK